MTSNRFSRRQFIKTGGLGLLGTLAFPTEVWPKPKRHLTLYVGTYTTGSSEGIYGYEMDRVTGALSRFGSFKSINPSFLTIDRQRRFLYAVNEINDFGGQPSGSVSAFAIDPATRHLRFLNEQATRGADPCHLSLDRKRRALLVANYTGGSVTVLPVRPDGTLDPATDVKRHEGAGIKEQQKGPHAHCVILDRRERHALVADLGIDKVMVYRFQRSPGRLTSNNPAWAELKPGAGPRHLSLHPNGKYLYVINELDSTLTSFAYNEDKGTLIAIDNLSTLPGDFSGVSYCADVHVSPSGRFLYGSNRGHNSIVVFEINKRTGKPSLLQHVSTEGDWPRNFTLDPTGRFLLVANQRSDNVVTFAIDPRSGRLQPTGRNETIPAPVCLRFL